MTLYRITEPPAAPQRGFALWALGFRPFYLGGALFATAAMLAWLAELDGHPLPALHPYLPGMLWHIHEMIFGFAAAIVAGFLLTAVRAWTTVTPAEGKSLAALWGLWLAGRVAVAYGSAPIAITLDIAFLPVCAIVLLRVLVHAKNRHNVFLPIALALLATTNLVFHLAAASGRADLAVRSAYVAVGLLVLFVTIIGGRIIPSFTVNAIPGFEIKKWRFVESSIMLLTLLPFLLDGFGVTGPFLAVAAAAAAFVQGMRVFGWRSWRVGNRPILTILHIAYAWIPVGFVMLTLAALGVIAHTLAIHTFTVGAIGGAIIAMMTRTARGHTGRPLVAGYMDVACYVLLVLAAVVRVVVPALAPQLMLVAIDVSAACWIIAFAGYFARYAGWLAKPRVDGKPG
ncbi:NnrS family protein [Paraburkholderia dinghuensis]|uniref:NnrS family protein n=1 Tax=Paraburkholderia dinghuensis TaxID=2305225 RepID=A0A3N6ME26_9BURK|nr:NnrS family protein [Paraburkholderia dinghuensis]RQH02129.1 NnrS family protein [Paraburkholderia dinghuensis]